MIIKERSTPIKITYLEALLRRLPYDHLKRSRIEEDLVKRRAGYRGEKALDQFLINHPLTDDLLILNDLRLSNGKQYFQIDSLLINNQFALILETKNIYGTLFKNLTSLSAHPLIPRQASRILSFKPDASSTN